MTAFDQMLEEFSQRSQPQLITVVRRVVPSGAILYARRYDLSVDPPRREDLLLTNANVSGAKNAGSQ